MERSLSILLPVHNRADALTRSVQRLLERASELSDRIELLIVDDGSSDLTPEIAHDLARRYPQVGFCRHRERRGLAEVIRTGLARTSGEIVFLHEGRGDIDLTDLQRLWLLRNDPDLVLARRSQGETQRSDGWIEWLFGAGGPAREDHGLCGFHMLRRDAVDALKNNQPITATANEVRLRHDEASLHAAGMLRRPNFLARLRQLALEE